MRFVSSHALVLFSSLTLAAGCTTDDAPQSFFVSVENISQVYDFPASGTFNTPVGASIPGLLQPGMAFEFEVPGAPGTRLSMAMMFGMSNDFFYAPNIEGIALFNSEGQPIAGNITDQFLLWDAGTELNQEPGSGSNQPRNQPAPNTGPSDPSGIVRLAPDDFENLPDVDEVIEVMITPVLDGFFHVRIENVSDETTLQFTGGESAVFVSPGVWVIHSVPAPLFSPGKSDIDEGLQQLAEDGNPGPLTERLKERTGITGPIAPGAFAVHQQLIEPMFSSGVPATDNGLEALAEDGLPTALALSLLDRRGITDSGSFDTPQGSIDPAPAQSGQRYDFQIQAKQGDHLSLATMLVQSNDLFFAFDPKGIPLFNQEDGKPISGDVSDSLGLWDAGSEVNQFPGLGPDQAPRQANPNEGESETAAVAPVNDGFEYPAASQFVRVTITPLD